MSQTDAVRLSVKKAIRGLLDRDLERFLEMFADDAVMEFPLALPGELQQLEGKTSIRARMSVLPVVPRFEALGTPRIFADEDQRVACVEMAGVLQVSADTPAVVIKQAVVIEFGERGVVRWTDYRASRPEKDD